MLLKRISKDKVGWDQVVVMCLDYWLDAGEPGCSLQDSIGWELVATDDDFYYLGRRK